MRNVYYTYHVSRSDNPDVEKSMETIEDVQRYTKLSVLSIYKNMLHEGNVKGWTVSRTPLPKNKKEKSPTRRGVIVRKSNGYISRFDNGSWSEWEDGYSMARFERQITEARALLLDLSKMENKT